MALVLMILIAEMSTCNVILHYKSAGTNQWVINASPKPSRVQNLALFKLRPIALLRIAAKHEDLIVGINLDLSTALGQRSRRDLFR